MFSYTLRVSGYWSGQLVRPPIQQHNNMPLEMLATVFTRIEARASISFRDFVDPACKQDQACNQGRLLFITLLSCTSVVMIFTCFHFR